MPARPQPETHTLTLCPCGSGLPEAACCARWHRGVHYLQAPDPVSLMRSRYTAFVRDEREYLLQTWHPSTRPPALEAPAPGLVWLGLEIRRQQSNAQHGRVEFVARSKLAGRAHRLHETSRFVCEDGRWYYLDGDFKD